MGAGPRGAASGGVLASRGQDTADGGPDVSDASGPIARLSFPLRALFDITGALMRPLYGSPAFRIVS